MGWCVWRRAGCRARNSSRRRCRSSRRSTRLRPQSCAGIRTGSVRTITSFTSARSRATHAGWTCSASDCRKSRKSFAASRCRLHAPSMTTCSRRAFVLSERSGVGGMECGAGIRHAGRRADSDPDSGVRELAAAGVSLLRSAADARARGRLRRAERQEQHRPPLEDALEAMRLNGTTVEVTELVERADNAIKFVSDMFSARLYRLAAAKVGVPVQRPGQRKAEDGGKSLSLPDRRVPPEPGLRAGNDGGDYFDY